MRIRLIAAGTRLPAWVDEGVADYARRFGRGLKFELIEVPLAREAERMRTALREGDYVVALEVQGRAMTTPELAGWLAARMAGGRDLALLVGGPDGLDARLSSRGRFPLVTLAAHLAARPGARPGRGTALSRPQPVAGTPVSPSLSYSRGSMGYDSILLASASERRSRLLAQIGVRHRVRAADIDEAPRTGESPRRLRGTPGRGKARAVVAGRGHRAWLPGAGGRHNGRAGWIDLRQARGRGGLRRHALGACRAQARSADRRRLWHDGRLHEAFATSRSRSARSMLRSAAATGRAASRPARRVPMPSRASERSSSSAWRVVFPT